MAIEAILFDKDGTLFDFEASWADWMNASILRLAQGDGDVARHLAAQLGFDLQARRFAPESPVIAGTIGEVVPLIAPLLPAMDEAEILTDLEASAAAAPMAPTVPLPPLLGGFRKDGYALGVATNATMSEATAHLEQADIAGFFDFIAGCDAGYGAKPGPGMCTAFADHLDRAPDRIVMVGDSLHDLVAGRAAGMRTVAVLTGIAPAEELAPFAEVVLRDIGALPAWLDGLRHGAPAPAG